MHVHPAATQHYVEGRGMQQRMPTSTHSVLFGLKCKNVHPYFSFSLTECKKSLESVAAFLWIYRVICKSLWGLFIIYLSVAFKSINCFISNTRFIFGWNSHLVLCESLRDEKDWLYVQYLMMPDAIFFHPPRLCFANSGRFNSRTVS